MKIIVHQVFFFAHSVLPEFFSDLILSLYSAVQLGKHEIPHSGCTFLSSFTACFFMFSDVPVSMSTFFPQVTQLISICC